MTGEHVYGSPANNVSVCESVSGQSVSCESIISDIGQLDGNNSFCSNNGSHPNKNVQSN